MKSQSIVKSGAAIGGAVALLLISALLAPSPALAGGTTDTCKLSPPPTGVEPGASGQAKLAATLRVDSWGQLFYHVSVTVSCKGLTPGKSYYVNIEAEYGGAYAVGVASRTGSLVLRSAFTAPYQLLSPSYVSVYSDAGVVLEGYVYR